MCLKILIPEEVDLVLQFHRLASRGIGEILSGRSIDDAPAGIDHYAVPILRAAVSDHVFDRAALSADAGDEERDFGSERADRLDVP